MLGVPLEALQLDQPLTVVGLDSVKAAELYGRLQDEARLSIRLDLVSGARIGPGKVAVLEEIARSGSISAAGRVLRMSM